MKYYPINLDVSRRRCLVVGGGGVGTRKVGGLLKCGATVTVVGPEISPDLEALARAGTIELRQRAYRRGDLDGMFLVIGATDNAQLNRQIQQDAEARQMLCNIADVPEACNFILPSIVERGDLIIAISTSGNSPAFAKQLRRQLEKQFGEEYAEFLRIMGAVRKKLLREAHAPEAHKHLFEELIDRGLFERVREGRRDRIDAVLTGILGDGFRLDQLEAQGTG